MPCQTNAKQTTELKVQTYVKTMAVVAGVSVAASVLAADAKLKVGDSAPELQVGKWIQGEPVKEFAKGTVYIVEFWATWCGPCRISTPHLNELSQKFKSKGLVVIGQSVFERVPDEEAAVKGFIKSMKGKMTYRVALDDKTAMKNGAMAETWMEAAGLATIPTAFIVNQEGKIVWIGNPLVPSLGRIVEDVIEGRFDAKRAVVEAELEADRQRQLMALNQEFSRQAGAGQWAEAERILNRFEELLPEAQKISVDIARFQLLVSKKDFPAAYKLADKMSEARPEDVELQQQLAWTIATGPGLENRDLVIAERIAERANKASGGNNPDVLDTLARLQFMNGRKEEAVATQRKAVDQAEGRTKTSLAATLASYLKGDLPPVD